MIDNHRMGHGAKIGDFNPCFDFYWQLGHNKLTLFLIINFMTTISIYINLTIPPLTTP